MGTDEDWELATNGLRKALEHRGLDCIVNEGDGAFYGSKIDFHLKDSIGRTWQCGTIQYDMQMPEKFNLTYVGEDGEKHRPIMLHRVVYGSIRAPSSVSSSRTMPVHSRPGSPVRARILPITDKQADYAYELRKKMFDLGLRIEVDDRSEKIGKKIRESQMLKTPYSLVVGDQDKYDGTVAVASMASSRARR